MQAAWELEDVVGKDVAKLSDDSKQKFGYLVRRIIKVIEMFRGYSYTL